MGILLAPLEMLPLKQSKNILPNKAKAFCLHSSPRLKTCGFSANEIIIKFNRAKRLVDI